MIFHASDRQNNEILRFILHNILSFEIKTTTTIYIAQFFSLKKKNKQTNKQKPPIFKNIGVFETCT